jgi:hypothetical protein
LKKWTTIPEADVRMVYRCPECMTEYRIPAEEASIPYCTEDDCPNEDGETDFERIEVRI